MPVIESSVDRGGAEFRDNHAHMESLVADLKARLDTARAGGGADALKRQREQGKLPTRERVELLLDPGTPFLEIGALAANGLYDGAAPSAGLVTGIARVRGREVMVVANDPSVKGGTYFPMTVKKHLRAQEIAQENRLPFLKSASVNAKIVVLDASASATIAFYIKLRRPKLAVASPCFGQISPKQC
jgi:3-methylcrotonyl-CoA carboxylase beta subunit